MFTSVVVAVELLINHFIIPDTIHDTTNEILFRWTSSLWKLLWRELLVYTLSFLGISVVYRVWLPQEHQLLMEKLIRQTDRLKLLVRTNHSQVQCPLRSPTKLN